MKTSIRGAGAVADPRQKNLFNRIFAGLGMCFAVLSVAACGSVEPSLSASARQQDVGDQAHTSDGLDPVTAVEAPGGYDLEISGHYAYVATFTAQEGVAIFDISDVTHPVHVGGVYGMLSRGVSVLDVGGRTLLASSTDSDLHIYDVTNPARPKDLAVMGFRSHNVTAHPEAGLIYNSRHFDQPGGVVEIIDVRDPDNIRLDHAWAFPGQARDGTAVIAQSCHDIFLDVPKERAYCAGYQQTLIWDIHDPWNPEILTAISNPAITTHHTAMPILDGKVLLIGDEHAANFTWGCYGNDADQTVGDQAPLGALWFYDLTTDKPEVLSWIAAPPTPPEVQVLGPLCTSHNGEELGDSGLIAWGWFHGGILLFDASDPTAPMLLDRKFIGGAVGDAQWYDGHVLAVDDLIGLTVLQQESSAATPD